jgi:hypothetical protein
MSDIDEIKIRFEWLAKYTYGKCDVAYGRLYLNDMHAPALRVCIDTYIADLPLKIDNGRLLIIEKAPYFIQIPPYRYVVYTTAPDTLYLITLWEARRVFCTANMTACAKLPPVVYGPANIEYVYTTLKSALT